MSAHHQLLKLYQQWRYLTEAEGLAIQSADWETLAEHQDDKQLLQDLIQTASDGFHAEIKSCGTGGEALEKQLRQMVNDLTALELRNGRALAVQRQLAEKQEVELQKASRSLRQIQRAYAPGRQASWHSYS